MADRHSQEFVERQFQSEGYTLIGKYENAITKLDFLCPNGHRHSITWSNFKSGYRCAYCFKPPAWTKEEEVILISNFSSSSWDEIRKLLPNRSVSAIASKASKLGLQKLKHDSRRRLKVNDNFFETWSDDMAWVLGLFFADGNMTQPKFPAVISFTSGDLELLELVRKLMESEHAICGRKRHQGTTYSFAVNSQKLWDSLLRLGATPAKSLTLEYPVLLPDQYFRSFVRGYIDGDGCLFWQKNGGLVYPRLNLLGTQDFLNGVSARLNLMVGIKTKRPAKLTNCKNTFAITYCGREAVTLAGFLYQEGDACLERKKRVADKFRFC